MEPCAETPHPMGYLMGSICALLHFPAQFLPPKQFRSSSFYFSFLSRVKMNSTNWPAPNVWVFIAQLVEHCSTNAEAMGLNAVEIPKFLSG